MPDLHRRYRVLQSFWERRVGLLIHGREAVFLAGVASLLSLLLVSVPQLTAGILTGACVAGFAVLIVLHDRAIRQARRYTALSRVAEEMEARRRRDWDTSPVAAIEPPPGHHPYGGDLDLFGKGSLLQLLYTAGTAVGLETLRRWMLELPPRQTTVARQEAVRTMTPFVDFRIQLAASGRLAGRLGLETISQFEEWAESSPRLPRAPWLPWMAWVIPLGTTVLLALELLGPIPHPLWSLPAVSGLLVALFFSRRTTALIRGASLTPDSIAQLATSFRTGLGVPLEAPMLATIQQQLAAGGGASREIRRLQALVRLGEVRYSRLLHFLFQGFLLWDLHLSLRLERWRAANGRFVRSWFDALGELESLCCLADVADGNPRWAFPKLLEDGGHTLVAEQLAHPLLPPDQAVGNDVEIRPGHLLFVTGSNMSGKSTLLRALGVNVVLGRIGGPVCATAMELTASDVFTYVHVTDSLLGGVSTFMAGLLRLKALVEAARRPLGGGGSLLFLLDEPLQGTNPAERQVAIRRILRHLLRVNASGAITSHDLSLLDAEDLAASATAVHFPERLSPRAGSEGVVFDYRLRPGLCTSTNAIKLMDAIGFPPDRPG